MSVYRKIQILLKPLVFLLLIGNILLYIVAAYSALPFADDFCFGWTSATNRDILTGWLSQYKNWNGRFTADFLVQFHPLSFGSITAYRLIIASGILAIPVSFYLFYKTVTRSLLIVASKTEILFVSLVTTLLYLSGLPQLAEGVYWFIGVVNYLWGNVVFLLQVTIYLWLFQISGKNKKIFAGIVSLFILVVAVGFNEVGAIAIPIFYLICFVYLKWTSSRNFFWAKLYLVSGFIALMVVALSPGNAVRMAQFSLDVSQFYALGFSLLQTIRFIAKFFLNGPMIAGSILVFTYFRRKKIKLPHPSLFAGGIILLTFLAAYIPYSATGQLGQHRTMNYVYFFNIPLWFLLLTGAAERWPMNDFANKLKRRSVQITLLLSFAILSTITGNSQKLISDFYHQRFSAYNKAYIERENKLKANPQITFPLTNTPSSMKITDAQGDTTFFADKCMCRYYENVARTAKSDSTN